MDMVNGEMGSQQLLAQAHIWNHIFNFINSMCLKCAIQLGIPDTIHHHGQPMTLDALVSALQIHPSRAHCVDRLMRILVHSGFFEQKKLAPDGQAPPYGQSLQCAPFALSMLDPILINPWHGLSAWFHNHVDPTPFEMVQGMSFWRNAGQEPGLNRLFNDGMASDARLVASMVVNEHKGVFEGITSLVDVGGGTGTMAKAIANSFPHMECTIFDLPHVVANLEVSENVRCVPGDMFEAIPPADAIILKWILHDWSDEDAVKVLKRCREALGKGEGKKKKVIIIEMVMDNTKSDKEMVETQLFYDMLMMTVASGRERNEAEWAKLFVAAGFGDYKITLVLGLRSLIEVYPS
ncbi:hypothetical protein EUGRSUZ_L01645 [Eucalyptus grandis]|uniref:O-methyltransferase domain-containing protein n=1 Tax=Eucalyptus grandis TaxID=71139 RepID=A0A058ZTN2_EUCGR|nr:hypothetical protein EUGRSUZ_L01645 [Eucalyptus grandis]